MSRSEAQRGEARGRALLLGMLLPLSLVVLWIVSAGQGWVDPRLLVPLEKVLALLVVPDFRGTLWGGLAATFARVVAGLVIGGLCGLVLGAAMGLSRRADRLVGPSFHAARQIAVFAWIPLLTAWLGNGEAAKIVFIALAVFYPVVMNTQEGFALVPKAYLEVGRVFRFGRVQILRRVLLPSAMPAIATGFQLGVIYAWIAAIGAEYLMGMGQGIGAMIVHGRELFRMDVVLLGVVIVGGIGFFMNRAVKALTDRLLRWRPSSV